MIDMCQMMTPHVVSHGTILINFDTWYRPNKRDKQPSQTNFLPMGSFVFPLSYYSFDSQV